MMWIWLLDLVACGGGLSDPAQEIFNALDTDGSGALTPDEMASANAQWLHRELDLDRDGTLDLEELRADLDRWVMRMPLEVPEH